MLFKLKSDRFHSITKLRMQISPMQLHCIIRSIITEQKRWSEKKKNISALSLQLLLLNWEKKRELDKKGRDSLTQSLKLCDKKWRQKKDNLNMVCKENLIIHLPFTENSRWSFNYFYTKVRLMVPKLRGAHPFTHD